MSAISKVLIVGFGSIGARHMRVVRALCPSIEIGVLHHCKSSSSQKLDDPEFFNIEDAIAFKPQIAILANPASFHVPVASRLASAGIHLLIEKPLSDSASDVRSLFEIAKKNHSLITVGYNLRFLKSLQKFKSVLESGAIGRINSIQCSVGQYLPSWRPGVDYRKGVSANAKLGGGVLLELSHELDYLTWIFGSVEWLQAFVGRQSNLEIDVEDSVHLIMNFFGKDNGGPIIASLNMDFIRHDATRICVAIGTLTSLKWDGIKDQVEIWDSNLSGWKVVYEGTSERDESYSSQLDHFLNVIFKEEKATLNDGLSALELVEVIRDAASSGNRIYFPSIP